MTNRERLLDELRPAAFAIAYRMLGSVSEVPGPLDSRSRLPIRWERIGCWPPPSTRHDCRGPSKQQTGGITDHETTVAGSAPRPVERSPPMDGDRALAALHASHRAGGRVARPATAHPHSACRRAVAPGDGAAA